MTQERRNRRGRPGQPNAFRIETRLTKSNTCAVIHADGAWGGLTPKGIIVMGLFTEQHAPPDRVTYEIPMPLPSKPKEIERQGGGLILREIQAQVFLDAEVARSIGQWLLEKADQADEIRQQVEQHRADEGSASTTAAQPGIEVRE